MVNSKGAEKRLTPRDAPGRARARAQAANLKCWRRRGRSLYKLDHGKSPRLAGAQDQEVGGGGAEGARWAARDLFGLGKPDMNEGGNRGQTSGAKQTLHRVTTPEGRYGTGQIQPKIAKAKKKTGETRRSSG